jgi:hypothetical protein
MLALLIPCIYHFLSRLQTLLARSRNSRFTAINDKCIKDLELMQSILKKAKEGIGMNLLAFRSPDRIYYSNSCPAGLGSHRKQRHVWHFNVPDNLQIRAANNLLKFLATIVTPWINIINSRLKQGDCALSMTNSTTAKGGMKKSNFDKHRNDPIQATTCINAARHYPQLFINMDVKG